MNHSYEERLGTDPMLRLIFRMALPAVAAQFVNLLYAIVDRVYIGHIPGIGTDALAGVGVTMSIVILISSFSAIVGAGGAPLAAIALGQGNRERAGKILGNGFVLLLLFTVVTSSLAYLFMEPVLLLTGASEHTLGYAEDYLSEDNKITYYKNITKVWKDLEKGTIDATIYDTTGIQNYMKEHADNTNLSVLNEQLNSEESNYGIMFAKRYKYLDQFNVALQVLNNDGTYQKLKEQWIKTKE